MTLDELDASYTPPTPTEQVPYGCLRHAAYWDHECKRGTKGCGVVHKEVEPPKGLWRRARALVLEREELAISGRCAHCTGNMVELHSVVRMPGIRYFVCSDNKSHTVIVMPKEEQ